MYLVRTFFKTDTLLSDIGGLSAFVTIFGTLYGIMTAFVVFEVWNQHNRIVELINKEGLGLERLYRLTIYFRDKKLTEKMKAAINEYAQVVIKGKFQTLAKGQRNKEASRTFRKITNVIRDLSFDDDHDQVVFHHIISHYGHLSEIRTERINESLSRLPALLKVFLYASSILALCSFVVMPFTNIFYGFFAVGGLSFTLAMIFYLVEDLDNPFTGFWKVTPEPFERALKHIEEDY